jgi:L-arabinonolactonase
MVAQVEPHGDVICDLGEGPLWCARTGRLYWHDVTGRRLHRSDAGGRHVESWDLPKMPGCFGLRRAGGLIAGFRNQLALFDPDGGEIREITGHGIDFGAERFNDGACDARGRFWVGSFDPSMKTASGCLYRVDPDLSVHRMDEGIAMANGLAWNPEGTVLYFADSRPGQIYRYAFDMDRGTIGPREVFLDYTDRPGRPDGCTVDQEGFLWVAEVTAGRISRYAPDGALAMTIDLPVSKPTSVAFGGAQHGTLFITTMRMGLSPEELALEPLAGRLLRVEPAVPGVAEPVFAG